MNATGSRLWLGPSLPGDGGRLRPGGFAIFGARGNHASLRGIREPFRSHEEVRLARRQFSNELTHCRTATSIARGPLQFHCCISRKTRANVINTHTYLTIRMRTVRPSTNGICERGAIVVGVRLDNFVAQLEAEHESQYLARASDGVGGVFRTPRNAGPHFLNQRTSRKSLGGYRCRQ